MLGLSDKQWGILTFASSNYNALICDGAVRSGKTSVMSLSFVLWAMDNFKNQSFAFCGKSVGAVERNIINPLLGVKYLQDKFKMTYNRGEHKLTVKKGNKINYFYLFGGKDESSYALIQGLTLAGVMLDEVALMPRSFVEQAIARCSVTGAKLWFNCNPANPQHWFRQEWILKCAEKKALHLHFKMDDNPSLSEETKARYYSMYSGIFYKRYILGEWVMSDGVIYSMFDQTENVYKTAPVGALYSSTRTISVDYGTTNPCVFLDVYDDGEIIRVDREYTWDSRKELRQKTDEEYADDFIEFMGDEHCAVIVDPSAASFIAALKSRGVYVTGADNDVSDGIRKTASLIGRRIIQVNERCAGTLDSIATYSWDDKAASGGVEKPIKLNDHHTDALRYYVNSLPDWRID